MGKLYFRYAVKFREEFLCISYVFYHCSMQIPPLSFNPTFNIDSGIWEVLIILFASYERPNTLFGNKLLVHVIIWRWSIFQFYN